jgi:hypothetical protein
MCGINAIYNYDHAPLNILDMIISLQSRGTDATGISYLEGKNLNILKRAVTPEEFKKLYLESLKNTDAKICIGHNRLPSSNHADKKKDTEAHPFISEDGSFAVIHNGTLPSHMYVRALLKKLGHNMSSGVDSEIFVHILEELLKRYPRDQAVKEFYALSEGNIIILFKDGTLYGLPDSAFVLAKIKPSTYLISSEFCGIKKFFENNKILENPNDIFLYLPDDDSSCIVKITPKRAYLYGNWEEIKYREGSWIFNKVVMCDFCQDRGPCEKILIDGVERDRCLKCYRAGNTKLKKSVASSTSTMYSRYRPPSKETLPETKDFYPTGLETRGICSECHSIVNIKDLIFCSRCNKFYCMKCIPNHSCRQNKKDEDWDLKYFLGVEED